MLQKTTVHKFYLIEFLTNPPPEPEAVEYGPAEAPAPQAVGPTEALRISIYYVYNIIVYTNYTLLIFIKIIIIYKNLDNTN